MSLCFRLLICIFLLNLGMTQITAAQSTSSTQIVYREIEWEELIPSSWHPEKIFEGINIDDYEDNDPRLTGLLEQMVEEWNNAPANIDLEGLFIKIPGFIVPLDWDENGGLKELLLVPYFGACIHVPPPPANQIIYIHLEEPLKDLGLMDTIWVYGELKIMTHNSGSMGTSGYMVETHKIEPYR